MKSKKEYREFDLSMKKYEKYQSTHINHLNILWIGKYKNRNIYYIIASAEGNKDEFEFSKNWSYNPDWTDQDIDVDEFAAITYVMNQIRKEYPFLYLIGIRIDPLPEYESDFRVKEFTGGNFPMIEIKTKYGPSYHEGIIERPNIITRLVELGKDGDFIDFAEFIWSHKSIFDIYFLFCKSRFNLEEIKISIESAKSIEEYEDVLVKTFNICLIMNYGEGWMDILSSDEELVKKIISPYKLVTKTGLFKTEKTRLVKT